MALVVGLCFPMLLFAVFGLQLLEVKVVLDLKGAPHTNLFKPPSCDEAARAADAEALQYVPRGVVDAWKRQNFLIVFGIISVDNASRRRRRNLQRSTCWRFPGVATRANEFTGAMLVLYVLGRHPAHDNNYSAALLEEAARWNDVLTPSIDDGRVTTNKTVAGNGFWGLEAEIGMSRKTYFWYDFALRQFPTVPYLAKGDDDMFLRVPQFLADLRTLPLRGIYWGLLGIYKPGVRFRFSAGICVTLSRDVAQQFVSYKPLQRLVRLPYSSEREPEFISLNLNHEDAMVGRVLHEVHYKGLLFVKEKSCRFHDVHRGFQVRRVSRLSVVVHHLWESEYEVLMRRFGKDISPSPKKYRRMRGGFVFDC
ncbi:UDP-Gal or UDP-GlcNAc-dependent glycosyltransferase [Trypanosoma conorhini]|uniref:Hexosyltransferase n=1 Tax=Trypanosoma conorhini TaxID=83891 RepID=A0A3R7PG70_9TRYP|nr:UDP-Gal or UDP-GlcNAc-dependent glycosyltransferase [Trypanosoma conorhini]RNF19341.1 UDP-Gal or UDP-GlcNAc-dependent glycosyltransferase [Trypanosoma conorhini]